MKYKDINTHSRAKRELSVHKIFDDEMYSYQVIKETVKAEWKHAVDVEWKKQKPQKATTKNKSY